MKPTKEQIELLRDWKDKVKYFLSQGRLIGVDAIEALLEANTAVTEERVRREERKRNSLIVAKVMAGTCSRTQPELSNKLNEIRLQILSNNQD